MTYLALDTASRVVSVALGGGAHESTLFREMEQTSSSKELLPALQSLLAEAETDLSSLSGMIAVRGPGSFTGIRVGLATVLGFHQALAIPATALGSLEIIAASARSSSSLSAAPTPETGFWGAVWALRDEWYLQHFAPEGSESVTAGVPERLTQERWIALLPDGPCTVAGHSVEELVGPLGARVQVISPPPLAVAAVQMAGRLVHWDPGHLTDPLYVQGPSVTLPATPKTARS